MADGRIEFEIRADKSNVDSAIRDTTGKLKNAAGQWESATQGAANATSMFGGVLQGVGQMISKSIIGLAIKAAAALVQFGKDCLNAASDLEEVRNVVDTVFGESANEIYSWAQKAQTSFGLAQTAALKYASTLGAMMKSSGLGMDEVTTMSTTLAGLAADMASFYNLDFDTAFEKIKSGISGQTEPLKALGIDLSAASLEAFRLAQGIDKAYSNMSQAEQIALRYQYIMQATADAQGDFARTSDGYANSVRRLESAWANLKTIIGPPILEAVSGAMDALADLVSALTTPPEKTIFEEIAQVDIDYESEVAEIKAAAAEANALIDVLEKIHTNTAVSTQRTELTELLMSLSTSIPGLWEAIQGKDPSTQIATLASALSNNGQGISMTAWTVALETYGSFAGALAEAMQSDDPTGKIKALAEQLAPESGISVDDWIGILTTFGNALATSNISTDAETIEGKISKLATTMSMKSGIDVGAWKTAFTYFGEYKDEFFTALSSDDPGAALDKLANKLAADYPGVDFTTWQGILRQLATDLKTEDANLDVSGIIEKLGSLTSAVGGMSDVSLGNLLQAIESDAGTPSTNVQAWTAVLETFSGKITGFGTAMNQYNGGSSQKIQELATALSGIDGDEAKVRAWQELVGLLVTNADEIQAIMGWTADDTWEWMTSLLDSVNDIDPTKADSFEKVFGVLLGGDGKKGLGDMAVPENVVRSYQGLTAAVDSTYFASESELEILKRLMEIYPQLSSIVNIHTGEVKGGIEALRQYVDEAETARIKLAMQRRLDKYQKILEERKDYVAEWKVDLVLNTNDLQKAMLKAENMRKQLENMGAVVGDNGYGQIRVLNAEDLDWTAPVEGYQNVADLIEQYHDAEDAVFGLSQAHDELAAKVAEEEAGIAEVEEQLKAEAEAFGMSTDAKTANAAATGQVVMEEEAAAKALSSLKAQIQDIVNYQDNVRRSVLGTISQAVDGLKELDRTTDEYRKSISGNNLIKNLNDQLAFLEEYSRLIDEARSRGFTDEVISSVADGSVESLQYLRGLATATSDEVRDINDRFGQVTAKKNDLADKLTAQRLAVDEEYQAMIKKAEEAALAMDQSTVAGAGAAATMEAVVTNVAAGRATLQGEVDAIIALMAQIGTVGGYTVWGASGGIIGTGGERVGRARAAGAFATPHALGLDYVPYDGYLAELHQGETVLTADEAAIWRNFAGASEAAGQQAFDYDMIGAMINGIPSGGNVYLDGQTVGRLISQGQGESYRRLQRSGWRG